MHYKLSSSIPGFYSQAARNSAPLPLPDIFKCLLGGQNCSSFENWYSYSIKRLLEHQVFIKNLLFAQDLIISKNTKEKEEDKDLDHKKIILYPWMKRIQMGDNLSFSF